MWPQRHGTGYCTERNTDTYCTYNKPHSYAKGAKPYCIERAWTSTAAASETAGCVNTTLKPIEVYRQSDVTGQSLQRVDLLFALACYGVLLGWVHSKLVVVDSARVILRVSFSYPVSHTVIPL